MSTPTPETPPYRYTAALAGEIERSWQQRWAREGTFHATTPSDGAATAKTYVLDMFPYPSGAGLHVGHPLGYIGTDVWGRYQRMTGRNVLHTIGFDAFGLPAEQYAIRTGTHPALTTARNIERYRAQLRRLGFAHDERRSVATTDPGYVRWTQWIFLRLFESWYDPEQQRARPISELPVHLAGTPDDHRLAYLREGPVNWCPGLGTVLSNEEVTADGRSVIGNHPVFRRTMRQWMLRITAYADRLLDDLDRLDWPESIKAMQRHWIGRSHGSRISFAATDPGVSIDVFTTRPDTLLGASYLVLAPEHPLVDALVADRWPRDVDRRWTGGAATPAEGVAAYRAATARKTDRDRQETREKTGVFLGALAINPATGGELPVFVADYVLMGYGTGAIMAVPAHDDRDLAFADAFGLPVLDADPAPAGVGQPEVRYKLRDWLFSRQRYWGEPLPIVYDAAGVPHALPDDQLPLSLPEMTDFSPVALDPDDPTSDPVPPLSRAEEWARVRLDLGDGEQTYTRELNVMPQWAGSCWYELRYLDPDNTETFCDPAAERYWMGKDPGRPGDPGGVDLYVGGVEHAVLHLLYARFWHKVLFDLGHVSSEEPYRRLFNQGYIQAYAYTDERGVHVPAAEVVEDPPGHHTHQGRAVRREFGKMGKSLNNVVTPDEMCDSYGADVFRVYEMAMGPLDVSRPWQTRDVIGAQRFLQRLWRLVVDEHTGALLVTDAVLDPATRSLLHTTIAGVREDYRSLTCHTAIAKLITLVNHLVRTGGPAARAVVEPLVLMTAPVAPHLAEELWHRLGHPDSLAHGPFPTADPDQEVSASVSYPVQIRGKVRATVEVAASADPAAVEVAVLADSRVRGVLSGAVPRKVVVVPGRMISIVL